MSDVRNRVFRAVEKMPAFPKSVHQVLVLAGDINCSQKELVEVIKNDPVFTLKILRLVNSAFFGLAQQVTSIHHASVYLGLNTLKNVALGLAAIGTIPKKSVAGLDMGAFWLHSLAVASASRMLGERLGATPDEAGDYFAAGLLHDIGKVVFALYLPDEFQAAMKLAMDPGKSLLEAEQEAIGMTHADIGALLAQKWNLPPELREAIALHHAPDSAETSQLVDCVFIGNQISKKLSFGNAGNFEVEPLPERIRELFDMNLDELVAELDTLDEEVEKARVFIKLGEAAS
ncbi:HDOD domain-containing protein [Salidesulfovibrio onnuriiensis]|uniref:HDOD domain-containing protein n=1 Tax=Salidesulfovibrio onnuriiensis TaxID=2583823 RepID=UPI0011CB997E|nr:HDOD domain-containing protein [Salidesulfovibrio onnuriiensis]